jgi:predicted negative regulator of RcsB-dependent stress response
LKVIISVIIAIAIFVGFALWTQHTLDSSSKALAQHLDKLELSVKDNNWGHAANEVKALQQTWSKTKNLWQILINHEEVDNIDSTLAKVKQLVGLKEKADSLSEIAVLKLFVLHIPNKESLSIVNIL